MTKDKAKSTASALNREGLGGITYEAKPQDWRDGEYFADHKAGVHDLTHFAATDWKFTGGPSDIVAYRVRP